ncbi:uncharacterized protein FPRO_12197 [Fusarium proliferatum ET1]|uniref:Uncharacterized protein n=1 Tax=Fusarium proliferatum (strain ET1) TaxID=1227346 RepID=A0A1L7W316_FUSPR|nr:uncharacterized protein FPRO_12197 [Fusarium proliferatum ET1]CZR46746.1 uncharacterized protein FPRO_12197 [Fusarium proliferatum ET1]
MEKHFKHSERQVTLRRPNDYQRSFSEKELSEMATSGYFGGTPLEIVTVFPHRDLFVLQHNDLDKIDWGCLGFEASLALPREGFSGVDHVGIEYDRAWGDGYCIDEDVNCTFLKACVEANYTIWFIDRYLKRKSQGPAFKEESDCSWKINAFYASDRKLLEIKDYDDLFKDWEYIGPVETEWYDHMHHSLSFVRQLRADLTDQYITNDCEAEKPCVIGLLGWAPL